VERNMHSPDSTPSSTPADPDIDALYEAFLPTLATARRSYIRKRLAGFLVLPILLGLGVAWAQADETAGADQAQVATETELPEPEPTPVPQQPEEAADSNEVETPTEDASEIVEVDLGIAGSALVEITGDGMSLVEFDLADGWEAEIVKLGGGDSIAVVLSNGDTTLLAKIDRELTVEIEDITPPPEPEIQTRKEITVGDVGRVVVERDGDTLVMAVLWQHDWYEAVVVTPKGLRVYAYFTNDGVKHHVEAWIEGTEISHGVWETKPELEKEAEPKKKKETGGEQETEEKRDKADNEEPEIQTRKEIFVGEVGKVVVEREESTLWLGVLWSHDFYDAVVVSSTGAEVHAYFTNDGFEHHVRAWIKGPKIKHETWVVEPEIVAYDGTVTCGFGNVGVLVEGNVARVMSVQAVEGVEATIVTEVGEVVRVRFATEDAVWIMDAWGNGESVVSECGQDD
jgi:hypothetical protein